jgi:hypothetical protein
MSHVICMDFEEYVIPELDFVSVYLFLEHIYWNFVYLRTV